MKDRLVPAAIIPAILDLAIKNRMNVEKIFSRAKVDPAVVSHGGTFVSIEQELTLFEAAYQEMNNPAFGILLGESIQYNSLDLVGQLVATSKNVQEALDELFQFKDLITPFTSFTLTTKGQEATLVFSVDSTLVKDNLAVHHDLVASTIVTIANAIIPNGLNLKKACFVHSETPYADQYHRVFNAPVEFGCLRNALVFNRSILQEPLLTSYPEYHSGVKTLAQEKLKSIESRESLSAKVAYFITRNLGVASTQLEDVASHFNMTPRTLQRKLKQEETSFVVLRDQCRHARALRDLGDPAVEIELLAESLGFSDTSNFYHAFKRWQGVSPGVYRKQALSEQGIG
ncbi:MAG: AraC family transcriptional regulator [Pseudomonadales bacterium]|nr:AraC family transcriptional regulator [Pseudomonadales bacterium]